MLEEPGWRPASLCSLSTPMEESGRIRKYMTPSAWFPPQPRQEPALDLTALHGSVPTPSVSPAASLGAVL